MEKNQLNFSAPLMSARRYSSPLRRSGEEDERDSPPKNRNSIASQPSDVNMEEVVKPGSIPFMWEQTPGKAKGGNESQIRSPDVVPNISKLPPNMPFPPGKKSGELNGYRTPYMLSGELAVQRHRNKLSGEQNVLRHNRFSGELHTHRPNKWSGELSTLRPHTRHSGELKTVSAKFSCANDGMVRWDSSKEGTDVNASSDSENDDVTFSDAIETFSQHESFSINCSVSGVSASERTETKHSDNLPTDPKARDFMMNRFLPAAKAMTLEPSQYASRKQIVAVEQPNEVKALVPRAKTPSPNRNIYSIIPYTGQDIGSEESEDEEDSYDGRSALSVKVKACGFLPWFCSKNSLRLVNPLPSMKDRSKSALSSASKLSKLVKTKSWRSSSRKMVKHEPHNTPKNKVRQVYKSCELQQPKHTARPMFYSGELQSRTGSPYRSSRRGNVSPFRNESPQSLYQKGVGFLAVPRQGDFYDDNRSKVSQKGSKRFEESGRKTRSYGTRTPVVEKTLHVDTVNITKVSHSILNLPKNRRQVMDGSAQEAIKLENQLEYGGGRMEILKARGKSGPLVCTGADSPEPYRISEKGNTNTCRELVLVSSDDTTMQSALNPPLPKSPSESWLSRQLPSLSPRVSPRNSVSYSSLNSKVLSRKQNTNAPSGAKWETIVKSSHLRQDHGRYSEELVTHAPQQSQRRK